MSIVLIGGEKGGTGKTTIAVNLAVMRAKEGRDVLLLDTDIQGSASFWAQIRDDARIEPKVACVSKFGKGLPHAVQDLAGRYEDIVIDAGGRESTELRASMVVAERLYIPCKPSQFDLWTIARMSQLIDQARAFNENLAAFVIVSLASSNPIITETEEARELLADVENIGMAKTVIRERIAYRKAARSGLAVVEYEPTARKAVEEMRLLYKEVYDE